MVQKYMFGTILFLSVLFIFTKSEAIDVMISNKTNRNISCTFTGPTPESVVQQVAVGPQSAGRQSLTSAAGTYTVSCIDTADGSIMVDGTVDLVDSTQTQQPSSLIIEDTESGRISLEID